MKTQFNPVRAFLLGAVLLALPTVASAQFLYTTSNGKAIITGYNGSSLTVTIPGTLGGLPVVVASNAFDTVYKNFAPNQGDYTGVTNMTISSGATIEGMAFNHSLITNLVINSGAIIQDAAFYDAPALYSVTLESGITSVGNEVFQFCDKLTIYSLPNTVTSIGAYAFSSCNGLTNATLPGSVTSIGDYAFSGCDSLTNFTIPGKVTSLGNGLFQADPLIGITMGNDVVVIGTNAFGQCADLTTIILPATVATIAADAFNGCSNLFVINIPNNVTNIGAGAFEDCTNLPGLIITNNNASIGAGAFADCRNLTTAVIGDSAAAANDMGNIGSDAFQGCTNLANVIIGSGVTNIAAGAFYGDGSLTNLIVGNGVLTIGNNAFQNSGLVNVVLGKSITSIGDYAFQSDNALKSILFLGNLPSADSTIFYNPNDLSGQLSLQVYYAFGTYGWGSTFLGEPARMFDAGSLQVNIVNPPGVNSVGAAWLVDGVGPFTNGADFNPLLAGTYLLTFSTVPGCIPPPAQWITVTAYQPTNVSVSYADTNPPTVSITNPVANASLTNGSFTLAGAVKDNVQVADADYELNGAAWNPLTIPNGGGNWAQAVTLTPGTNVASVYAVDSSGNKSTNTIHFQYEVAVPLQLQTNGLGTISSITNNAPLNVGQNYTVTATAASGFVFTNWLENGGIATNRATLVFMMESNLVLTANFADTTAPTLSITNPAAGNLVVTNAGYTFGGKARDLVAVTNVYYSLNGSAWTSASSGNHWTNWSVPVTLTPGTNTISAYAVNASGEDSATVAVPIDYATKSPLQLMNTGLGTISPDYSNALLVVGQNYSVTATPGKSYGFTGWTDGNGNALTNEATLLFAMESNLVLVANFIKAPPVLSITSPLANASVSNAALTVSGKVSDPAGLAVTNVYVSVGGSVWKSATTSNGWTNWTAALTLTPGTNQVLAYAVDINGNASITNTVPVFYRVPGNLQLWTYGLGTASLAGGASLNGVISNHGIGSLAYYNGTNVQLNLGENYTLTEKPGSGFVLSNWMEGVGNSAFAATNLAGTNTTLTFVMQSNLVVLAAFADVAPPVVKIVSPAPNAVVTNGSVLRVTGTAMDNAAVQLMAYSLNGSTNFVIGDTTNNWFTANYWTNWTATVTNLSPGTNLIMIIADDPSGNFSTNTLSVDYAVPATVTVDTGLGGTVSPNYNGQSLNTGQNYTMTAKPSAGFIFSGWYFYAPGVGEVPATNSPVFTFQIFANATFAAAFTETSTPALTIAAPSANASVTSLGLTVSGKASDNGSVQYVFYNLNSAGWNLAASTNNWTNWTAVVTLTPGTNVILVEAVNGNGLATTNTVRVQYAVAAPLTLGINHSGYGTVSPYVSGVLLNIGQNYTVTATPGSGFAVTNWTGGIGGVTGYLTNAATLQFMMQSNLTLQANFVDLDSPVLSITNPAAASVLVSNASYTVSGTAGDKGTVAGVYYRLSNQATNSGWVLAGNASGNWSNWVAAVSLNAGTNIVSAYAADVNGHVSGTNTVRLDYIVSGILTVQTNGLGTVSPNDNGAFLQMGASYALTATAGKGFAFTNWTSGTNGTLALLTNGPTVKFTMVSNLVLQANFADVTPPTLSITNPAGATLTVSNASFILAGKAGDNVAVSNVFYSVNSSGWVPATEFNNWSNWTAAVTLNPGTNILQAYAVDTSGNVSPTSTVKVDYVVTAELTVSIAGRGTISPNYSNAVLVVNQNYSVTATAVSGFAFTNWMTNGVFATSGATLPFEMESNLVLQATFVDVAPPTLSITNPAGATVTVSNASFTLAGKASDNVAVANVFYSLNSSGWQSATTLNGWTNWAAVIALGNGYNLISVYAVDSSGNVSKTNTVQLTYQFTGTSPTTLAGLMANIQGSSDTQITFGADTFGQLTLIYGQLSLFTNAINGVGNYTYTQMTATSGVLSVTYVAPPSAVARGGFTNTLLTFINPLEASFTNAADGSSGTIQFTAVPSLAPGTVAGQTIYLVESSGKGTKLQFTNGMATATDLATAEAQTANYTYTLYGQQSALLTASNADGTTYIVTTAEATNLGNAYKESYDLSGNISDSDLGWFGIASQEPGGNAPPYVTDVSLLLFTSGDVSYLFFGAGTFNQMDLTDQNNYGANGIGTYTYTRSNTNNGLIDLTFTSPPTALTNGNNGGDILFVAPDFGIFTNGDGNNNGSGYASLTGDYDFTNYNDGMYPFAGLVLSGTQLYGTTRSGGDDGSGTVFVVNTDGTGYTNLYSFSSDGSGQNADGANPQSSLVLSGNTLYGTASGGGDYGSGTVFAINTDGSGFTTLYSFTDGNDGGYPLAGLVLSGNRLYGTANSGGPNNLGAVFVINTDGTDFTTLYDFSATEQNIDGFGTNSDGANPVGGLVLSGGKLYGTASAGGLYGLGTAFSMSTNGVDFETLHNFTGGNDGANLQAGLVLFGNTLYGTAYQGGADAQGTVFSLNTNGTDFQTLYNFTGANDGSSPSAPLVLSGGLLYGTAAAGGVDSAGTVFSLNPNGSDFTTVYALTGGNDGATPTAGLVVSGNSIYGTAQLANLGGPGAVFTLNASSSASVSFGAVELAGTLSTAPASLSGKVINASSFFTGSTYVITNNSNGMFTYSGVSPSGTSSGAGTFTYKVTSPETAMLQENFTSGDNAGSVAYIQMNFYGSGVAEFFLTSLGSGGSVSYDAGSLIILPGAP